MKTRPTLSKGQEANALFQMRAGVSKRQTRFLSRPELGDVAWLAVASEQVFGIVERSMEGRRRRWSEVWKCNRCARCFSAGRLTKSARKIGIGGESAVMEHYPNTPQTARVAVQCSEVLFDLRRAQGKSKGEHSARGDGD